MKIDTHQHFWHYHAPDFPWIDDSMAVLRRDCVPGHNAAAMRAAQEPRAFPGNTRFTSSSSAGTCRVCARKPCGLHEG